MAKDSDGKTFKKLCQTTWHQETLTKTKKGELCYY